MKALSDNDKVQVAKRWFQTKVPERKFPNEGPQAEVSEEIPERVRLLEQLLLSQWFGCVVVCSSRRSNLSMALSLKLDPRSADRPASKLDSLCIKGSTTPQQC